MKRYLLLKSNLLLLLSIIACFTGIIYADASSYQELVKEHVETVVCISSTDIKNELENSLTTQVTMAKTMANDTLLQE